MNPHKILIFFLVLVVPGVTYLLAPGFEERLAMRMRTGEHREVAAELEKRVAAGDERTSILATLGRAYEAEVAGKLGRAIEIMETYVSRSPRDPEGFRALAGLYAVANRPHAMLTAQALLVAVAPSRVDVSRLLGLYRLYGRFDDERELLSAMQSQLVLELSDVLHLGETLAAKGEIAAAIDVLVGAVGRLDPDQEHGRLLLFELLAASGRTGEAVEHAERWLSNWRKPWLASRFLRRLAQAAPPQDLERLVDTAVALHPESKLYFVQILIENGRRASAIRTLSLDRLQALIETSPAPSAADVSAFLAAVQVIDDPAMIWRAFSAVLKKPSAKVAQVELAEALASRFGFGVISSVRSGLSFEALSRKPLFAARLAVQESNHSLARKLLQEFDVQNASPDERSTWVALMTEVFSDGGAFQVLSSLHGRGKLPNGLLPSYAALAARVGRVDEYMLAIAEIDRL